MPTLKTAALLALLLLATGGCATDPAPTRLAGVAAAEDHSATLADEPLQGTLILVRHAERDDAAADGLSPQGRKRAALLAKALADAPIDVVLTSDLPRTISTASGVIASSADRKPPLIVERFQSRDDGADAAAKIRPHLAQGRVVLAVGHSNQVDTVLKSLGGWGVAPLSEKDYGFMFIAEFRGERPPLLVRAGYPPATN